MAGQGTQREIADRWGIDRSTVAHIVKLVIQGALERLATSRPGRPGKSASDLALEDAQAEIERLRATVTEQAVELHQFRETIVGTDRRPSVPTRVDAGIKIGLLALSSASSSEVGAGRRPSSASARRTHSRTVSARGPSFSATEQIASHCEPYSSP